MMQTSERQLTIWDECAAQYPTPFNDLVELSPTANIQEAFIKHYTKFREFDGSAGQYQRIMVSISGGSDSDILIDMIERIGYQPGIVRYVFFNTGIEFRATKDHIKWLEQRYDVTIEERKAKMPTPLACQKYGVPFLSKRISDYIARLQHSNFRWEDGDYSTLIAKYPGISTTALKWWCNEWGNESQSNICRRTYLKEFMIANPPNFAISDKCCIKSKKRYSTRF